MVNASLESSVNQARSCFFKQIDEKNMSQEVQQMLWNPKMDLIAIAFLNGDIHLYRMSWQRVWTISCPHQSISIVSMAWRPDGKILAVSYSNGHLRLLAVEDAKKIFSFECNEPIQWLYWLQENEEMSKKHESYNLYEDISKSQLPKPISYDIISQLFEKTNNKEFSDNLLLNEASDLTFLVCAYGTSIAIFVYGYFLLIDTNLDIVPSYLNYKQLKSCFLSDNMSLISALGLTEENLLVYSLLDTSILNENHIQIKLVSAKFGLLFSMLTSVKSVIKEMEELWEDILVEMDQKFQLYALEKYNMNNENNKANNLGVGNKNSMDSSLVNDFMLLYTFGTCSEHFKQFLLQELTEKGLKKLEVSVENYYTNIQRLLNGNFQQIILNMFYHLNELYGMIKWTDKFKIFSLTEPQITNVMNQCASLILKGQELSFVIDQNMKEIKLFFKWLHASMTHLNDDQSGIDMIRFNEEMENSILDFIQNTFKDAQTINLEKVGQYLKQENLKVLASEENSWQQFLKNKLFQKENHFLFLNKKDKSLVGCFDEFKTCLNQCFRTQAIDSKQPFSIVRQYNIHKFNSAKDASDMIISYKCIQNAMITGLLMAKTNNECYILKHLVNNEPDVKAYIINLSSHTIDSSQIFLQDVCIYGENSVTLLGTDSKTSTNTYLAQLNLQPTPIGILNDLIEVTSYSEGGEKKQNNAEKSANKETTNLLMIKAEKLTANSIIKCIKRLKTSSFCVSSSRKVAALLNVNRHRVKIFELEVDEEDEEIIEDEPVLGQTSENDNSELVEDSNCSYVSSKHTTTANNNNNPYELNAQNINSQQAKLNLIQSKQFIKHQSNGSTCSLATQSVCSSTAATIGSTVTMLDSSSVSASNHSSVSNFMRTKRKIDTDEDEDDFDERITNGNMNTNQGEDMIGGSNGLNRNSE